MRRKDIMYLTLCVIVEIILFIETLIFDEMALECLTIWTIISLIVFIKAMWEMRPIKVTKV